MPNNAYFPGSIDEVAIYGTVLSTEQLHAHYAAAMPAKPVATAPPTISGYAQVGGTLSTDNGTWTGAPSSFAYQWRRCAADGASCTDIPGATAPSYVVVAQDLDSTIRVVVTGTNALGAATGTAVQTQRIVIVNAPTVTATIPIAGTLRVDPTTRPSATFSRAMSSATLSSLSFSVTPLGGTPIAGQVAWDSTSWTATFTPTVPLFYGMTYTAQLDTTVKAADGMSLADPVTWTFSTSPAPPTVTATTPTAGATDVSLDAAPTATFSKPMDASTITATTFTLTSSGGAVAASVGFDAGTQTATLTPSAHLAPGTTYTARLDTTVTSEDGVSLATAFTTTFTTNGDVTPPVTTITGSPTNPSQLQRRAFHVRCE